MENFNDKIRQFVDKFYDSGNLIESYCSVFGFPECSEVAAKAIALFTESNVVKEYCKQKGPIPYCVNINQKIVTEGIMRICQDSTETQDNIPALKLQLECYDKIAKIHGLYKPIETNNTLSLIDIIKNKDLAK